MNVQLILIHAAFCLLLFPPGKTGQPAADTLQIKSVGENNSIIVDSMHWHSQVNDSTTARSVKGEINQIGENNSVEINTGGEARKNKKQITNKCQNSNNKNQTKRETCNPEPATVKIKQTGKNNTIKINSQTP